jgi:hypothetical protein
MKLQKPDNLSTLDLVVYAVNTDRLEFGINTLIYTLIYNPLILM